MKKQFKKIAITGGTHGDELTGVYLINKFTKNPDLVKRDSFETIFMHTNLGAMKQCTRYVDKDLNRTFTKADLNDTTLESYEDKLAKEINQKLGPKGSDNPNVDFIMDLHSTTSNMGLSLCISKENKLSWQVAAYVKECIPELHIFSWKRATGTLSVATISPSGFTIEVGSVPQGVLKADMFFETQRIIQTVLDFFELYNTDKLEKTYSHLEIYDNVKILDFPRDDDGVINAMIHPNLQENGYIKLKKGDPIFVTFDGDEILYEDKDGLHGIFINEAAYYEKGVAMCLAEKKVIKI